MGDLPLVEIGEVIEELGVTDCYQEDLLFLEYDKALVKSRGETLFSHARLNALALFLVLEGEADLTVDHMPYKLIKGSFLTLMPSHTLRMIHVDEDFRGYLIAVSSSFMNDYGLFRQKNTSMLRYMEIRKNPCAVFEPSEAEVVRDQMLLVRSKIRQKDHYFYKEIMQNALAGLMLELGNIFSAKKEFTASPALSRKEDLLEQFLKLLFENCREQHGVAYYAERLFITPQYLSLILKTLTGKSANKWIDDALIMEARVLLKAPQATVQQVADLLHFSDQSTFGKFFKKHMLKRKGRHLLCGGLMTNVRLVFS